ncbi:ribosome maturation factor RimP [Aureimonas endophytica]|uniref:Ribosome maturation factor RimP n=1 Tax=Aureimonas endophytica TaxID=2027858 RepID=A0A917A390_9HYPH|nr:ribosome maturation factor RimP [Aureimonas endophytica]GGE21948.1 ribosome maturation factor RimP [Aureimonas endophytica]
MTDTVATNPSSSASERRLVTEAGLEGRIAAIVEPVAEQIGFRLVRVKLSQMNGMTLQIMAERPDGTMSIEDCEMLSRAVSPVLDIEDPIDREYHLEVSSPGIDRPLVRRGDFEAWAGHLTKVEANRLVDGRKRWRGRIVGVEADHVRFERDQVTGDEAALVDIPFDAIGDARLVLTDDLIDAALKADKAARRGQFSGDADNDNDEKAGG